MTSLNQKIVIGNIGKDPEHRVNKNGVSVVNFTIATDEAWTTKTGERKKHTDWHRCQCSGKKADAIYAMCKKGDLVFIQGPTKAKEFTVSGVIFTQDVLHVENFMLLDKKTGEKNEMHT